MTTENVRLVIFTFLFVCLLFNILGSRRIQQLQGEVTKLNQENLKLKNELLDCYRSKK